jgi:AAA ATPase domain
MASACPSSSARTLVCLPVTYHYRYCDRCRREWPAERMQCPECLLWLGPAPRERIEWQLAPSSPESCTATCYENICAATIRLRLIGPCPADHHLRDVGALLHALFRFSSPTSDIVGVDDQGWLLWSSQGARQLFQMAVSLRDRLIRMTAELQQVVAPASRLRWGIWVDDCILPWGGTPPRPCISAAVARWLFDFEPDDLLLVTEAVFRSNRRWEHFVCIPARRHRSGDGYRPLGQKHPSALDHAKVPDRTSFVGRLDELALLDAAWLGGEGASRCVAILAPAGAGKTRLVNAWLQQRPRMRSLRANFSIFGGDLAAFAAQLVELPEEPLTTGLLVERVVARLRKERVDVLVLDDLHWADDASCDFLQALLKARPTTGLLTLICARPGADAAVARLQPNMTLRLQPLPPEDTSELAQRLGATPPLVAAAAHEARGNPLYVEQLVAWASETHYVDGPYPTNLHEVVLARIAHLAQVRLHDLKRRASWLERWMRSDVATELDAIEREIGLWLDRLETGDYADRDVVAGYLERLHKVEFELFLAAALLGRPRPRSTRLREAIERLLLGSSDGVLADMTRRAEALQGREDLGLAEAAERAGDYARDNYRWVLARRFYQIAQRAGPIWTQSRMADRQRDIDRLLREPGMEAAEPEGGDIVAELERNPSVDAVRLPEVRLRLGRRFGARCYYLRALRAADEIGATGLRATIDRLLTRLAALG